MRNLKKTLVLLAFASLAFAQVPQAVERPLDDRRLTIHTLVREDIFAGFLNNDLDRLALGEKNIETLLVKRPAAKAELLAWKAGALMHRAIIAHESKQPEAFKQKYQQALDLLNEARTLAPQNPGVAAVSGGVYSILGDRLPKEVQADGWQRGYEAFQTLWKQQGGAIDKLPTHIGGELLGGLALTAQRLGRTDEANGYLDKMIAVMPETPYGSVAKKWKENPNVRLSASVTCLNCHESGRLAARLTSLNGK